MFRDISSTFRYQLLTLSAGLALSIVTARALGPEGRGVFAVIISTASLLSLTMSLGLPSAVTYFVSNGRLSARNSLALGGVVGATAALLTAALIWLSVQAKWTTVLFGSSDPHLIWLLPIAVGVGITVATTSATLKAGKLFVTTNRVTFGGTAATLGGAAVLLAWFGQGNLPPSIFYQVRMFLAALVGCILFIIAWRRGPLGQNDTPTSPLPLFKYGTRSIAADILQFISYRLDYWVVAYYLGVSSLGIYTLGVGLAQYLWILPGAVASVLFPSIAGSEAFDPIRVMRCGRVVFLVTGCVAISGACALPLLVPVAYGNDFGGAAYVYATLCLGVVPFCLSKVYAAVLAGHGLVSVNMRAAAIGAVLTVALDVALIPSFGILGAAIASATAYVATTIFVVAATANLLDCPWQNLVITTREDLRLVGRKLCLCS